MADHGETLTIQLFSMDDDHVDAEASITTLSNTIRALTILGEGSSWQVTDTRRENPFLISITAEGATRTIRSWLGILQSLEESASAPEDTDIKVLEYARRALSPLGKKVRRIRYVSQDRAVEPTHHLTANVDLLIEPPVRAHYENTTLRGWLDDVKTHGKKQFVIYDTLTDEAIACRFQKEDLQRVLRSMNKIVSVTGRARYDDSGRPKSITVEAFQTIESADKLPQMDDLKGIDVTDGDESSKYVRKGRDEE